MTRCHEIKERNIVMFRSTLISLILLGVLAVIAGSWRWRGPG
jgi:hypothetical protein